MSAVMRQNAWGGMPRLQDEINRLFGNARENDSSPAAWSYWPVRAALPGCVPRSREFARAPFRYFELSTHFANCL
jgi:hypothetical protein